MKKVFVLLLASTFISTFVIAQVDEGTFRLYGGANLPTYAYSNNGNKSTRDMYTGFNAGLMLSFYGKSSLHGGGHLGLVYSQKGAVNNSPGTGYSKSENRLSYLHADFLGSLGFGKNRKKGTFADLLVGFYFGRILEARQKLTAINGTTTSSNFNIGTSSSDDFIKYDLGLKGGLLFTLSSKWTLMAAYEYGLSDIAPNSNLKINNRNVQLSAGYNFGYKRN